MAPPTFGLHVSVIEVSEGGVSPGYHPPEKKFQPPTRKIFSIKGSLGHLPTDSIRSNGFNPSQFLTRVIHWVMRSGLGSHSCTIPTMIFEPHQTNLIPQEPDPSTPKSNYLKRGFWIISRLFGVPGWSDGVQKSWLGWHMSEIPTQTP